MALTMPAIRSVILRMLRGVKATVTMLRNSVCRGGSVTMNDSMVSSCGKSSMKTPSAELNTSTLRDTSRRCLCLTSDQKPLAFCRLGSRESGASFQLIGVLLRSHVNASWR